ncbi:MAG TPA: hypothetical protein VIN66_00975 [Rheinheimera sp.]|uniref:hypothetical protein n=1 Tax=Rheinheimera sp. TaxID=1869214 RepID=UPI002F9323AE
MDVNKKVVNGIPSAYYFKYKLGRTGVYGTLKRSDPSIDDIYNALKRAELYRFFLSKDAIARLRDVRKKCNALLNVTHLFKDPYSNRERTIIKELKANLDRRIDAVATHFLGVHKEQALENYENRLEFEAFYDKANLNGKAVGRTLDNEYRYERANSRHLGKDTVKNWLDSGSQLTLNTWMDTVRQWAGEDGDSSLAGLAQEGVQYLDEQGRQAYKLHFAGGMARDSNGDLFHSGNLVSSSSGAGWGIYMVDFYGNFYVGSHRINRFHHSSFFSGAAVMAGGEIAINSGKVVGVTNKTGHYKARPEELNAALTRLMLQHAVDLRNVAVSDPFNAPDKWFKAMDAIQANGILRNLPAAQEIAKPARVPV